MRPPGTLIAVGCWLLAATAAAQLLPNNDLLVTTTVSIDSDRVSSSSSSPVTHSGASGASENSRRAVSALTCSRDGECPALLACLSGQCQDPCTALSCPLEGAHCQVTGRRPVCSCPPGTVARNNSCVTESRCTRNNVTYTEGQQYYDDLCTQRCECHLGSWLCEETRCSPGLLPRGLLDLENDPQCQERAHPAGDECCVLWVCADETETEATTTPPSVDSRRPSATAPPRPLASNVCENVVCGEGAACEPLTGECQCAAGSDGGDPNDLVHGCKSPKQDGEAEEGVENIKLLQITSTTIQVQFPDITGGNLMYVDTKLVGRKDPPWENAIILEGNEIFTLTGLHPATRYTLRWKTPEQQYPDIEVSTAESDIQKPKVIIAKKELTSVLLSFDPFSPPGYSQPYLVSWREEGGSVWQRQDQEQLLPGDMPTLKIEGLKPGTRYKAKIALHDDTSARGLGKSTEEVSFRTVSGCLHNTTAYPVGNFNIGCESACHCKENGEVECGERCPRPFYSRGGFAEDPLCVERTVDDTQCCVLVTCADAGDEQEDSPCQGVKCGPNAECKHEVLREEEAETICVCQEGFTGDPDSKEGCSRATSPLPGEGTSSMAAPSCVVENTTYSAGATWYDGCEYRCQCSRKLEILCQPRCKIIAENANPRCSLAKDPEDSCCDMLVCPSQSNNTDILQPSLPFDGCVFKNSTYQQGERFFDGCEQQCQCMGFGDLVCLSRCPPINPEIGDNCYTLPDLTDSCCNITVCDKVVKNGADVEKVHNLTAESVSSVSGDQLTTILSSLSVQDSGAKIVTTTTRAEELETTEAKFASEAAVKSESYLDASISAKTAEDTTLLPIQDVTTTTTLTEATTKLMDDITARAPRAEKEISMTTTTLAGRQLQEEATTTTIIEGQTEDAREAAAALSTETAAVEDAVTVVGNSGEEEYDYEDLAAKSGRDIEFPGTENDEEAGRIRLGIFSSNEHGIKGQVYAVNNTALYVEGFSYDGTGEEAQFYAGTSAEEAAPLTISAPKELSALEQLENKNLHLRLPPGLQLSDLRYLSVRSARSGINYADVTLQPGNNNTSGQISCFHAGRQYLAGEEFHDGCLRYCLCQVDGQTADCFDIQCPSKFGLDVISPDCIEWDEHTDFVPSPPACCPPVPVCRSDGSCSYQGQNFSNYASLPQELTGCEQRCHCENGEVLCSPACYAVSQEPPVWLECDEGERPGLVANPERECCKIWGCEVAEDPLVGNKNATDLCSGLPTRLLGTTASPINESSIAVVFEIPEAAAGHEGHYVINFASGFGGHPDPERWPAEVFKTFDGRIDTKESARKVFGPLVPNTEYFLRPVIVIKDCGRQELQLVGEVLSARTLAIGAAGGVPAADAVPLVVYLDLKLEVSGVGSTTARVAWRHFEPDEKPYIDGVQLRYLALKGNQPLSQVPETTPFIHRDTNYFVFEGLKPDTRYEVEVDLIPLPASGRELYSGKNIEFTTEPLSDIYDFILELRLDQVGDQTAEVSWDGVPSPDQKFINIYRVIYHANSPNSIRDESSIFKISKIDSPKRLSITNLQPNTEYQVWLEAYLTNGKMKKSNVAEFKTAATAAVDNSSPLIGGQDNKMAKPPRDFYGGMVAAAIIAAFALLAFVVVLYFYMKRNITYKATITKERPPSGGSYDNHGFKELDAAHSGQSIEMGGLPAEAAVINGRNGQATAVNGGMNGKINP